MKERKDYEKPAMRVVKLQYTGMLMGSKKGTGLQNYWWFYDFDEE